MVAIPQSGFQVSSLWPHLRHSGPVLTLSNAARTSLPSPRLLVADAGVCAASPLRELPLGTKSVGFNYLFIFPPCYVARCASKAHHRLARESVSWCVETSLPSSFPPQDRSLSLTLLSLFLSFIFSPTSFQREWAAFLGAWCLP